MQVLALGVHSAGFPFGDTNFESQPCVYIYIYMYDHAFSVLFVVSGNP